MQSNWWQTIGLTALLWLMMSDTIDRMIPVPVPVLDPAVLRAAVPELVETNGQPDLRATLERLPPPSEDDIPMLDVEFLRRDRVVLLRDVLEGLKALDHPAVTTSSKKLRSALREQPPDPTYAVSLVADWYNAAELAVATGTALPLVPLGSPLLTAAAARPLAERMVNPLSVGERSKATAEILVNATLMRRRVHLDAMQRTDSSDWPGSDAPDTDAPATDAPATVSPAPVLPATAPPATIIL